MTKLAFLEELQSIMQESGQEKAAWLSPSQAIATRGGLRGILRGAAKRIGLVGERAVASGERAAIPRAIPVNPAAVRAETAEAAKRLGINPAHLPESFTELRPGFRAVHPPPMPRKTPPPIPSQRPAMTAMPRAGGGTPRMPGGAELPMDTRIPTKILPAGGSSADTTMRLFSRTQPTASRAAAASSELEGQISRLGPAFPGKGGWSIPAKRLRSFPESATMEQLRFDPAMRKLLGGRTIQPQAAF
jgi:hypothetical protein